jgi:hypothetical protein
MLTNTRIRMFEYHSISSSGIVAKKITCEYADNVILSE